MLLAALAKTHPSPLSCGAEGQKGKGEKRHQGRFGTRRGLLEMGGGKEELEELEEGRR
jgi:hypothetical protein